MSAKRFYQRLYGLMCVLLLLQECHPMMRQPVVESKIVSKKSDESSYFPNLTDSNAITDLNENSEKVQVQQNHLQETFVSDNILPDVTNSRLKRDANLKDENERKSNETSFEDIKNRLYKLAELIVNNDKNLKAKIKLQIYNCSIDETNEMFLESTKNPNGIMNRLIIAVLYSIADCHNVTLHILYEICDAVDNDTIAEMLDTYMDLSYDFVDFDSKNKTDVDDEVHENMTSDDSVFMSNLLSENILNIEEMSKLFDTLEEDGKFENTTDVETMLSELDSFSLDEILDQPNYKWIKYPASDVNSTADINMTNIHGSGGEKLLTHLNSNSTKRMLKELSVPLNLDAKTNLIVIYEKTTQKMLTGSGIGEMPKLKPYDMSALTEQVWVLDDGLLVNVGTHYFLHPSETNKSIPLMYQTLSHIDTNVSANCSLRWTLFKGRLMFGHACFLDTKGNSSISWENEIHVSCDVQIQNVSLVIASFMMASTPEKLLQHEPERIDSNPFLKLIGPTLLIFMYFLGSIIEYYINGKEFETTITHFEEKITLEDTFFIKHYNKPCKLLGVQQTTETEFQFYFDEFEENFIENQLWYWKDLQVINVATQKVLETNHFVKSNGDYEYNSRLYARLWTYDNGKIKSYNNQSCDLVFENEILVSNCSSSNGKLIESRPWTFISFDQPNFQNFNEIVCMYFIQTSEWPCEFLTADDTTNIPILSPIKDNIFSQLWYMSKGRLVNADLGFALTHASMENLLLIKIQAENISTWEMRDKQLFSVRNTSEVLTLNEKLNGTVSCKRNLKTWQQLWEFTQFETVLLNETSLECTDRNNGEVKPFIIRNTGTAGCKILTAVERNGRFKLEIKEFQENLLHLQTWVIHRDHLMNVATGLSIEPDFGFPKGPNYNLVLRPVHSFHEKQMWLLDEFGSLRWRMNTKCFFDFEMQKSSDDDVEIFLCCEENRNSSSSWTFTYISHDNENDGAFSLEYMCFYFIRSVKEPCHFLTADEQDGSVTLRPLIRELLEKQLWFWKDQAISLVTTGQYLSRSVADIFEYSGSNIILLNPEEVGNATTWSYENSQLFLSDIQGKNFVVSHNNGQLQLADIKGSTGLELSFDNYDYFTENDETNFCSQHISEETSFFFLRLKSEPCKVLTGADLGKPPTLEHFDQDKIESQLWYYKNNHILNLGTNLAIQIENPTALLGSPVIMYHYFKYSNSQKWRQSGAIIFFHDSDNCVLEVNVESTKLIVWCETTATDNQLWDRVDFNDASNYTEKLTCMFFLRNERSPCELLTYIVNEKAVKLRPPTESFLSTQIWYWSGQHIINAKTGLALHSSYSNVLLKDKVEESSEQIWIVYDKLLSLQKYKKQRVLSVNPRRGHLEIVNYAEGIVSENQQWNIIDFETGLENLTTLSCEVAGQITTYYYIKNKNGNCPVLTERTNGDLTLKKAGDSSENQFWLHYNKKHIVSAKSFKALALKNGFSFFGRGRVFLQTKYEYELLQYWTYRNYALSHAVKNLYLDASYDVCVSSPDNSDDQKWVLLDVKDVQRDNNLLRCSKCYNKIEEKAYNIISYIPIINLFYSIGRAATYVVKGCYDVVISTITDFGISLLTDAIFALVTVISGGTLSSLAYGFKIGLKAGLKAGVKAALKSTTSAIKLAVRQALKRAKSVLSQSLKKTVIKFSKKSISNVKLSLQTNIKSFKKLPSTIKEMSVKSVESSKTISTKLFKRIQSTPFGSFKTSIKSQLIKLPTTLKTKIKNIGNRLADRAQRRITKLEKVQKMKPKGHARCKRSSNGCFTGNFIKDTSDIDPSSAFVQNPEIKAVNNFNELLNVAKTNYDIHGLQNAHFGLTRKMGNSEFFDTTTVKSRHLNEVKKLEPIDKNYKPIGKSSRKNRPHTEQDLLDDMHIAMENCKEKGDCKEMYIWTKNSPCMQNTNFKGEAKSCFSMFIEFCYQYVKIQQRLERCQIGFKDFYGYTGKKGDPKKDFLEEMRSFIMLKKNLADDHKYGNIPKEALNNVQDFIKFTQITG